MAKAISERVSYSTRNSETVIVITGKIERWKESLLLAWFLSWNIIGGVLIYQAFNGDFGKQEKIILFVMIAFWVYFEFRIGKICAWRLWGKELLRINGEKVTYKRDIKSYGKAYHFFLENIGKVKLIDRNKDAMSRVLGSSFWVRGDEAIAMEYLNKDARIGIQLEAEEAQKLHRIFQKAIADNKRSLGRKKKKEEVTEEE